MAMHIHMRMRTLKLMRIRMVHMRTLQVDEWELWNFLQEAETLLDDEESARCARACARARACAHARAQVHEHMRSRAGERRRVISSH